MIKIARRKTRTVYRRPARRSYRRKNPLGGGLGKGIMTGIAIGAVNRFLPINIAGADYLIAGYFMKEPLITKLGAITLGRSLGTSILGGGLGNIFGGMGNGGGVR